MDELKSTEKPGVPSQEKGTNSKGKGRFRKGGKKSFKPRENQVPGNDFAYWNKYADYMKSVTNYPWMHVTGTPISTTGFTPATLHVGNVLVVNYVPSVGVCSDPTHAFNLMWRDTYLAMHRKYRGLGAYQQSDLGIVILCNANVFAWIADCERLYGIIHGYPVKNRVTPRGILHAMGYSTTFIDLLEANPAQFRSNLNRIILKAKRLCLPKGLTALYNWIGLNSFLYRDSKDNPDRSGIIVFQPDVYCGYSGSRASTGSCAQFTKLNRSTIASPDALLTMLDQTVDALLSDDDVTRICSDVIACFGDSGLEAMNEFPEDYKIEPMYDASILIKLHNAETVGDSTRNRITFIERSSVTFTPNPSADEMIVYQENNVIISLPVVSGVTGYTRVLAGPTGGNHFYGEAAANILSRNAQNQTLVDTWEEVPSDATRCEALLWKCRTNELIGGATQGSATHHATQIASCATEIIVNMTVYNVANNGTNVNQTFGSMLNVSFGIQWQHLMLSQLDWAPLIYAGYDDASGIFATAVMGDLDNYTILDYSLVDPVHDAALLSGFNIQVPGKSASKE